MNEKRNPQMKEWKKINLSDKLKSLTNEELESGLNEYNSYKNGIMDSGFVGRSYEVFGDFDDLYEITNDMIKAIEKEKTNRFKNEKMINSPNLEKLLNDLYD